MEVRWNDTGLMSDLLRPDALRAVRRGRAILVQVVEEESTKPEPKAEVVPQ